MIRLYDANETQFDHEETVLTVISCTVSENENGAFLLSMETPIDERVQVGKIVKASTPRGDQLFRIKSVKKKLDRRKQFYEINGEHVFYDLRDNLILNIRPTDTTAINALNAILSGTEYSHRFTGTSDVQGLNAANYVRLNPIQAIMGNQPNALVNLWGGYLKRDNFEIALKQVPLDRGYEVRLGKNLIGVEQSIDLSQVVTRIYPTVVIEGNVVTDLPEKYVDSPLIGHYPAPLIRELRINLTDEEKLLPIAQIYQLMRDRAQAHFDADADKPMVNYKVNFVQLGKTEEYKDLAILEDLDLSDMVHVAVEDLGILVDARVIKYTWDSLEQRFLSIELGNFKPKLTSQTQKIIELIEKVGEEVTDGKIAAALKEAIERITGHRGGYRYDLFNPDGQPSGTAYMDTPDVNTAQKYILINNQGIAFGDSGLSSPPTLAISIDGTITGDGAFFNSLVTNMIQSDIGQSLDLSSNLHIINKVEREEIGNLVTIDVHAEELGLLETTLTDFMSSQTTLTQEEFEVRFTEYLQIISDQGTDFDNRFTEIATWFRVTPDGLELGASDNPILLKIKPDRIAFEQGGQEVAYFSDSALYVTHVSVTESMQWGIFKWVHRSNGNYSLT